MNLMGVLGLGFARFGRIFACLPDEGELQGGRQNL